MAQVYKGNPPYYKIKDLGGDILIDTFYENELQKIHKDDDVIRIGTILKKRRSKRDVEYLVKWFWYPLSSIRGSRKKISKMPNINPSQKTSDIILFAAQVIAVYIIISISFYNLTQTIENKELWISLLSSSVGYLLPSPVISKHVSHPTD